MESQTNSDDSVVESNMQKIRDVDSFNEASSRSDNQSRKEQFQGFYKTQLTIAVDSTNSSMEIENQSEQKNDNDLPVKCENRNFSFEELTIPKIVENCVLPEDVENLEDEEDNKEDNTTTVIHESNKEVEIDSSSTANDTSEDEISEIFIDTELLNKRESVGLATLRGSISEESLVSVSDIDYYKIRHETHFHQERRISLVLSPYNLITKIKSFDDGDEMTPYHHPSIPYVKVLEADDLGDDGGETSDEDFNCHESDFMTLEEFMEAYKTNVDLDKNDVNLKISHSVHHGQKYEDLDMEAPKTESLKDSDSERDIDTDEENVHHSADCVKVEREEREEREEKVEHSEDCKYRKGDAFYTGQHIDIQAEPQLQDEEEDLSDHEKTCTSELNEVGPEMTDEELISDIERTQCQINLSQTATEPSTGQSDRKTQGKNRLKKRGNRNKKKQNETNN